MYGISAPTGLKLGMGQTIFEEGASLETTIGAEKQLVVYDSNGGPFSANQCVIWESNDETVATVNKTGKVIGLKQGTTTITAYISGSVRDSITLNVVAEAN